MAGSATPPPDRNRLETEIAANPVLSKVREALEDESVFIVGGTVRDLLVGLPATDLDLVVEGDVTALATRLDTDAVIHERFGTAELEVGGHRVDLVRARTETYPEPGALPQVTPAELIDDLARRDFTINAMAVGLEEPRQLVDPFDGFADLEEGTLRILRPGSFQEDPTRAIRAARYAARFGFALEEETAREVGAVDLGTVTRDRLLSEFERLCGEADAPRALGLLAEWGVGNRGTEVAGLGPVGLELLLDAPWSGFLDPAEFGLDWILGTNGTDIDPLLEFRGPPSEAVQLASDFGSREILLARAAGAEWLDDWAGDWRQASPVITGEDLVARGVPEGPAVGIGLDAALTAQLDRGLVDFDEQIEVALEAIGPGGRGERDRPN